VSLARRALHITFGAHAQVAAGVLFLVLTAAQTIYWLAITAATTKAVFIVSMEALAFAAYGVIATGLGYRATERVESIVIETVKQMTVAGDISEVEVEVEDDEN
jgi:membrane protein implicated in regulation of membrane protease activity